jgi:hypothetical protein
VLRDLVEPTSLDRGSGSRSSITGAGVSRRTASQSSGGISSSDSRGGREARFC